MLGKGPTPVQSSFLGRQSLRLSAATSVQSSPGASRPAVLQSKYLHAAGPRAPHAPRLAASRNHALTVTCSLSRAKSKLKGKSRTSGSSSGGAGGSSAAPPPSSKASTSAIMTVTTPAVQTFDDLVIDNNDNLDDSMDEEGSRSSQNTIKVTHKTYYGSRAHSHRALVLDSAYRPVNVISWSKAVMMDVSEKCEVVQYYPGAYAVSGRGLHSLPAVVRVRTYVDIKEICTRVSCTRRNVLVRDKFQCQYCGCSRDLTIDHVKPVCQGGKNTWDNLVTACIACNQKKGSNTLHALGWKLKREPREPSPFDVGIVAGLSPSDIEFPPEEWVDFILPFQQRAGTIRRLAEGAGVSASDLPVFAQQQRKAMASRAA